MGLKLWLKAEAPRTFFDQLVGTQAEISGIDVGFKCALQLDESRGLQQQENSLYLNIFHAHRLWLRLCFDLDQRQWAAGGGSRPGYRHGPLCDAASNVDG